MGYDVERFLEAVNEGLLCCICRDVLEEPLQAPCEHAFCSSCIQAWLVAESSCPEDRQPLTSAQLRPLFRYMRNDLARLKIRCKNFRLGCSHISNLELAQTHEALCPLEEIPCRYNCGVCLPRRDMSQHAEHCEVAGRAATGPQNRECSNGCGLVIMTLDDREHNCIAELRTSIEVLRSEMLCKLEDQKREMELRLDMQRGHMVQRETTLKGHMEELKAELARVSQKVKLLLDMELQRRQELDRMQAERRELLELLNALQQEQSPQCQHCVTRSTSSLAGSGSKVTTL